MSSSWVGGRPRGTGLRRGIGQEGEEIRERSIRVMQGADWQGMESGEGGRWRWEGKSGGMHERKGCRRRAIT